MEAGGWNYLGIFSASCLVALVLTPVATRLALSRSLLDQPGGHKGHEIPVPYLGGVAIVLAFSASILVAVAISPPTSGASELAAIFLIGVALALMGLADDLRGLGPWIRLAGEVSAGVLVWLFVDRVHLPGTPEFVDVVITVAWVVGITNAFNLLDNMDGLSAGVAAIAAGSYFVIAADNGQFLAAALAIALAGCALGFLRTNFHPAKIYMGDAGSLFLGFMLAVLGIRLRLEAPTPVMFMVPLMVVGVAIFDTTLVTVTRLLHHRSPMSGGRDHTSHRLVFVGIPVRVSVALIYGAAASLGWLALVMSRVDGTTGWILTGLVASLVVPTGFLLGVVPIYETSRRRHLMIAAVVPHEPEPVVPPGYESPDKGIAEPA